MALSASFNAFSFDYFQLIGCTEKKTNLAWLPATDKVLGETIGIRSILLIRAERTFNMFAPYSISMMALFLCPLGVLARIQGFETEQEFGDPVFGMLRRARNSEKLLDRNVHTSSKLLSHAFLAFAFSPSCQKQRPMPMRGSGWVLGLRRRMR